MLVAGFALLGCLAALLQGICAQPVINSIDPQYGAVSGSTRLVIYGSNFGDMYVTSAFVFVGPYPCTIIGHYSSSEVLTCLTSPGSAGTYPVTVVVGEDDTTYWGFTYNNGITPTLDAVTPRAGPPGTDVNLYGDRGYSMYSDCQPSNWGDVGCVGSILFGDYLCRQEPGVTDIDFSGYQRYGWSVYRLGCAVPQPVAGDDQPALGVAGNSNVTIHFEASLRGAAPISNPSSFTYEADGTPYQFQLFPEVSNITPAAGSNAGGTLIKITGRGFPDLALGLPQTINVSVAGVPCAIVNSTYDTAFCITGAKPAALPESYTAIRGQYPAMRGAEYEFYNMTSISTNYYSGLWRLNTSVTIDNTDGTGSYKTVLTGAMEGLDYSVPYHCSRMKAFFKAPRTADYSFYMQADDVGQVNGSWIETGSEVNRMIINLTTWVPTDNWFYYTIQRSQTISLVAGQHLLLESAHCNNPVIGHQQLAFRMTVPQPQLNSIPEVQSISVSAVSSPRSVLIKYLYGAGSNTTTYTVALRAGSDASLDNARLGLALTINGNGSVVLPVTATGAEMDDVLEAVLGAALAPITTFISNSTNSTANATTISNESAFGVLKTRSALTLTIQFGIDVSRGKFNVTAARLVTLPPPAIPADSSYYNCSGRGVSVYPSSTNTLDVTKAIAVILSSAPAVAAVNPSGLFQLGVQSGTAIQLPYLANETLVASAVSNLTGYYPSVSILSDWREGPYFGRVWTVTFPQGVYNNIADLIVGPVGPSPPGVLLTTETRPANPPVTGSFRVAYGDNCASVRIDVTDNAETVTSKLASLPGMERPRRVDISGSGNGGYTFKITFDPIGNPGDQPPLRIVDVSGLQGVRPTAIVTTNMNGSTDAFFAPIPTEFLRLAVAEPSTIDLAVNGVPSACTNPSGICAFQYSDALTPRITNISPRLLSFSDASSLPLTITGTGFQLGPSAEVRVGTALCSITSYTATEIVCSVPDTAPAGLRLVNVNVEGVGFAAGAVNVTLETLFVTGTAPAPAVVATSGWSIFNITGKGFDNATCDNNKLTIGGVQTGIISCSSSRLTVLYPGGSAAAAAQITAQVFERSLLIDNDSPASPTVAVTDTAPAITAVSPPQMPGAGGNISVTLGGANTGDVVSVFLVPQIRSLTNYTAVAAAYKARARCTNVTASSGSGFTCTAPPLINGFYHVMAVLSSGLQILSPDTIQFEFVITSVSPGLGSIGGGTKVTIAGSGFSPVPSENAVFLTVPVSSTFLNGVIQCITQSVNATHLVCVTQAHLATNADANDPFAKQVMPVATQARPINVVICDASYNTSLLREWCWSMPTTPRARCGATGSASCNFGYSTALTPSIAGVGPNSGSGGLSVGIPGSYLGDVTRVQFMQSGVQKGLCDNVFATDGAVGCTVPNLLPGVYTLLLKKANGEMSVDPYQTGVFTFVPILLEMSNVVGSLAGGLPLTLTVGGAGLVTDNTSATANEVTIAGLPCPVIDVPSRTELTCLTPSINGYVFAEYWNLGQSSWSMPDVISFTDPVVARYERGTSFALRAQSPAPGVLQADFFVGRFTFYYQVAQAASIYIRTDVDDDARIYIDDVLIGGRSTWYPTTLTPGVHKIVITYIEYTGWASLSVTVAPAQADGTIGTAAAPDWQKVTPVPPGSVLPVDLVVNGIAAEQMCPETNVTLQLPYQNALSYEPSDLTLPNATCAYVYTTHRTPTLTSVPPSALGGILAPNFNSPIATMQIYGSFLTDPASDASGQINVTLADKTCKITSIAPFTYGVNSSSVVPAMNANGTTTNTTVITTTYYNTTAITCIAPPLPVGSWPVVVNVSGLGVARPPAAVTTTLPVVTYNLKINRISSTKKKDEVPKQGPGNSKCMMSMFGGGTFTVYGYGFPSGVVDELYNRTLSTMWDSCGPHSGGTPLCDAIQATPDLLNLTAIDSDGFSATFALSRLVVDSPATYAGVNTYDNIALRFKPLVYMGIVDPKNTDTMVSYETIPSAQEIYFCGGRTPALSGITPASLAPDAGTGGTNKLSLTWALTDVGSDLISASARGASSNATVEFEVGPTSLKCADPKVTASTLTKSSYSETLSCTVPTYMPAATYTLWLCIQPYGCGLQPAYTVPLTVSSISATRGSSAGGIVVVIRGKGFDLNANLTSARFGVSLCAITSSNKTTLVCVTGPLAAKPASPQTMALSVTPTAGTAEVLYSNFVFTFDPSLEATVSAITPNRGSTEGGTPVTISGSDFAVGVATTVTVGGTPCTNVAVTSSTTITCTTGKPPRNVLRLPLPVVVFQEGRGLSRGNVPYQYIDLWSRNSTWGGGPLPGFEDSVVIPEGVTVLLDISPPKLYILVLEGNLQFDETQPDLNLQAHYIIVKGGNFTIGSPEKPYPGRANITMHGAPNSRDLPMYGAKALAVRQGIVSFHGQPKNPIYTKLNTTVDPGATSITVVGSVNWQINDTIVIASSSFYANEVDEAVITALDATSSPGNTVITLDRAVKYTHLGEIHSQEGVAMPLDMRAEVAVLTRNIVLQGDWTSARNMYGVQVMVNSPRGMPRALVRFDNIEITQSGQAFRLGRYSMHWHMHGDVAYQSWVRGCSIHHTYNRAITVHGTHRAIIQNTLAYNTMGHTFFLEDGIEWGNLIEGNIGIYAKTSDALLNTDTTPATFWITNPNNTVRNNVAAGSAAYGFWYRMLDHPEGPSYTVTVCPKFTPLLEFTNNTAHSNMFYGLRVHPEFYPRNSPCYGFYGTFQQVPAVFNGLVAYKNGMKAAIGTQVGLVQFTNMVLGDNGGGPKQHVVNGKDNGASMELSWVVDDRNRYNINLTQMAGLTNATIYARTTTGMRGTAGRWPSCRRITGIISQSPVQGDSRHSALMSLVNVTFVDFKGWTQVSDNCSALFSALEHCGKCKTFQGGATTFTSGLSFVNSDGSKPMLSHWSWGHQGIYLDTDGTLLNSQTLPDTLLPAADAGWSLGPGATWHSAVESYLFDPAECVYVGRNESTRTSNDGAICNPALTFRRIMLNGHTPQVLKFKDLKLVSLATNRTSLVHFTHYNEDGYQFTVPTGRDYWVHWAVDARVDPVTFTLHKMDLLNTSQYTYITTKYLQVKDHFTVNGYSTSNNLTAMPDPANATHGSFFYNKTLTPNAWWWGNNSYNDTKFTIFQAGTQDNYLSTAAFTCPDSGCSEVPTVIVDIREGILYWSNDSTWNTSTTNFKKPEYGDNVTIPYGWNLVIDESPPYLLRLVIQGNVSFEPTKDVNITTTYFLVMSQGSLTAGSATSPHPANINIFLNGTRQTTDFAVSNELNLGSKFLAAIQGGTIDLHGRQVGQTWTRLAAPASIGANSITVSNPNHGWSVGDKIIITSTTFNVWQSEIRTITSISDSTLALDRSLEQPHGALIKSYPGGPTVDMRAEVGLVSSNILITALDGPSTYSNGGEKFGARVVVAGNSTGRFVRIAMEYCGQYGFDDRACVKFHNLTRLNGTDGQSPLSVTNPSIMTGSALVYGMSSNVLVTGLPDITYGLGLTYNVMYETLDYHSVDVQTSGNLIQGNLVLGTIKDMTNKSGHDVAMPSTFNILNADNFILDNVAAGGERYGFAYYGPPCSTSYSAGAFLNNTAHSNLAGMWLRSSDDANRDGCTLLKNFTTYMNWDFGIISTRGLPTDVLLQDVNILDTKHSGITLLMLNGFTGESAVRWEGGLLVGQSSADVCAACTTLTDDGCHKKLSRQSYNKEEPFTPALGLQSAQFALGYTIGPEKKPYDKPMGYSIVHGMVNITGITIADFLGKSGCGGADIGTYALANHPEAPEAFYPHVFSRINVVNVATGPGQGMFYHTGPNPEWRNEADCGEAIYTREDGSVIPLNCAGPAHVYWRDLDGSLTNTVGTTAGIFVDTPRVFPMDQGSPVLPGACTYSSVLDSYSCAANSTTFLLDPRLKPNPVPAAGIWGDPQHFVLESRDKDSEDRNFGPVFFNVSGSIDLVSPAMDHGWCFAYTCQKRLSAFWTYVPTGQTVYVNFTGTPSQNFRLWLPYADPEAEVLFVFNMLYTLNRRFVWLPESGRVMPETAPPQIGDGTGHASFFWDQDNTLLYVKMKGGQTLETRTENAVMISQSFAVTVDQFYGSKEMFLSNLAYAMGIDLSRIYVAKIVAGSVRFTFAVTPSYSIQVLAIDEPGYSAGVDPSDPVDPRAKANKAADGTTTSAADAEANAKAVLDDLVNAWKAYVKVVTDPNAANILGFQPLGFPEAFFSGLTVPDGFTLPTIDLPPPSPSPPSPSPPPTNTSGGNGGTTGNPSGNPTGGVPAASPSPTANPDVGPDTGGNTGGTGTTSSDSGSSDKSSVPLVAIIAGVVGGCVLLAIIAAVAVVVAKRRAAKRTRPVTPPEQVAGSGGAGAAAGLEGAPTPSGGSVRREAFTTESTGPVSPTEGGQPRRSRLGAVPQDEMGVSPRGDSSLAAGRSAASRPELIRPLVSTARNPHSSLPLVPPPSSAVFEDGSNRGPKSPADLGFDPSDARGAASVSQAVSRRQSEVMRYAPNEVARTSEGWDNDTAELVRLQEDGANRGGGAGPSAAPTPTGITTAAAGAAAAGGSPRPTSAGDAPMRPASARGSVHSRLGSSRGSGPSRPGSACGDGPGAGAITGGDAADVSVPEPSKPQPAAQQPVMLPGLAMTESLISKEAAAQAIAAVEAAQGAAIASAGSGNLAGGGGSRATSPVARSPADLRSDSMRKRED